MRHSLLNVAINLTPFFSSPLLLSHAAQAAATGPAPQVPPTGARRTQQDGPPERQCPPRAPNLPPRGHQQANGREKVQRVHETRRPRGGGCGYDAMMM